MCDHQKKDAPAPPPDCQQRRQAAENADKALNGGCLGGKGLPPIDFSAFTISLAHEALAFLGELPHPETNERHIDLPLAKQTIDILGMMEQKTRGNLTRAEEQLLQQVLYDVRSKFVSKCSQKS